MAPKPAQPLDLRTALSRYAETVRPEPPPHLDAVRAFQAERLRRRLGDHAVVVFFGRQMMQGVDLDGLEADPEASANRLERLLGRTGAAAAAIEFAALSETLDRELAATLADHPVTTVAHARAYRAVGRMDERRHQLRLVAYVVDELAGIAHSRWSYMAFRMARRPARAAGFGALYELLAAGFEALREDRRVEQRIQGWLDAEADRVARLLE